MKEIGKRIPKKLSLSSLVIVLSVILFLVGCETGSPVSETSPSSQNPTKVKEDLVLAVGKMDGGQFDPKKGWGMTQIRLTHSSLLTIDSDLNFIGDLAKSYTTSEDGLTWTFPLRDDAKFSNGEQVTAEDVKFTYEMLKEDGIKFDLTFVNSIEASEEIPSSSSSTSRVLPL